MLFLTDISHRFFVGSLLLIASCGYAADTSIQDKLKKELDKCHNQQVCCDPCDKTAPNCKPICVGDTSLPVKSMGDCDSMT